MRLVNVLVSTPNEPCAVLDIVDCSEHMNSGGKKDATYLADQFVEKIEELDPLHNRLDVIIFYGASNVQKSGRLIEANCPQVTVLHGAEHVTALFFSDVATLPPIKQFIIGYRRLYRVFGSGSMHAPYAMFQKQAHTFNAGRKIGLLRPSECRMAGYFIAFHRLLRLRLALMATLASAEYKGLKIKAKVVTRAEKSVEDVEMWEGLFVLVRCLFPPLRVLRLADKQTPGMDQLYCFVRRTDQAMEKLIKPISEMSFFKELACDVDDDEEMETIDCEPDEEDVALETLIDEAYDDTDDEEPQKDDPPSTSLPTGIIGSDLGQNILQLWKKRRKKLVSDFAIAGWLLSPLEEVRQDVKANRTGDDNAAMDRVLNKLLHGNNEVEMGELKDSFWTEWEMFHSRSGDGFGPLRKYIWNSELLRRRESAKWHAQYSLPFTKVSRPPCAL